MTTKIGSGASIPNPALRPLAVLVGSWQTMGSHPHLPGIPLHGRASFEWIEGGAFLMARAEIDNPAFPDGLEVFASDDEAGELYMLHFDERGVSRKYNVSMTGNHLTWWRDDPVFSQRFTLTVDDSGNRLVSKGEMSRDGAAWEADLALTYVRLGQDQSERKPTRF